MGQVVSPQRTVLRPRRCKDVLKVTYDRRRQDYVRPLDRREDSGLGFSMFSRDPQKHEALRNNMLALNYKRKMTKWKCLIKAQLYVIRVSFIHFSLILIHVSLYSPLIIF